jgi:hypothetical protein
MSTSFRRQRNDAAPIGLDELAVSVLGWKKFATSLAATLKLCQLKESVLLVC